MNQNLYRLDNPLERFQSSKVLPSPSKANPQPKRKDPSFAISVRSLPLSHQPLKVPALPKVQSSVEYAELLQIDPSPAMNFLKEIEATLMGWQQELRQVIQQIQGIYGEGPIIDGWLESHDSPDHGEQLQVQKAQRDRHLGYIEEIYTDNVSYQNPRTGYHLCGLDERGEVWSRPCPPEQVASVSVAIARYQKICELLNHKSYLEGKLNQLSETLAVVHHNLLH